MMKVGLVGLGYWGSKLLRNLTQQLDIGQIVAVDVSIDRLSAACEQYPGLSVALSLDEVLADEAVEAVLVATPVQSHARLVRQALTAGRHVFVEKPLAASVTDAVELASLAQQRELMLMVGHTFLYSPRVKRIAAHLATGQIGRIHYITSDRLNLGLHRSDVNVIWDLAPHDFSIIFHLLGEFPISAHATVKSIVRPAWPDVAFINLTFPSGTIASVAVSWLAPRKIRSTVVVGEQQMIVYDDTHPEEPIKIYDKGVVLSESPDFADNQLTYRYGDTVAPYVPVHEPLALEINHFLQGIGQTSAALTDSWFAVAVVRALEASDRSWRLGSVTVEIEPAEISVAS